MTSSQHKHKYEVTMIESCLIKTKETVEYHTRRCSICGLMPTTDFERYRVQPEKCAECAALMRTGERLKALSETTVWSSKEKRSLYAIFKMAIEMHMQQAHPERMTSD
jgi:hypothetical protein